MAPTSNGSKYLSDFFFYYLNTERFFLKWNSLPVNTQVKRRKGSTCHFSWTRISHPTAIVRSSSGGPIATIVLFYKEVDDRKKLVFVFPGHLMFVPWVSRSCQLAAVTLCCAGMWQKGEVEVVKSHSSAAANKQQSW